MVKENVKNFFHISWKNENVRTHENLLTYFIFPSGERDPQRYKSTYESHLWPWLQGPDKFIDVSQVENRWETLDTVLDIF